MAEETKVLTVAEMTTEVDTLMADKQTVNTLITTTFEGFDETLLRQAVMKAHMMEFSLRDILIGNVYAVKYRGSNGKPDTVQIITSVGHIRKIGARSGICGKNEPVYERDADSNIIACSVTVQKMTGSHVGDFSAKVYFGEYSTGKNLWISKPHTMIAKVAEAHAIRMACPEEAQNMFIAEEFEQKYKDATPANVEATEEELLDAHDKMSEAKTIEELQKAFLALPLHVRNNQQTIDSGAKLKEIINQDSDENN